MGPGLGTFSAEEIGSGVAAGEPGETFEGSCANPTDAGTTRTVAIQKRRFINRMLAARDSEASAISLLGYFSAEAGLLKGIHDFLVIEIAGDFKRLRIFLRGMVLHARDGFHGLFDRGHTFSAAKMNQPIFYHSHSIPI